MRLGFNRPRWPFDAGVSIALFALTISLAQFIFTTPVLNNFIVGPKLIVRGKGADPKSDVLMGTYTVVNEGNSVATKIELGFLMQSDQRINVMPNIGATIVEEKNPSFIKNVRIEIERLTPGESLMIIISPGFSNQKLRSDIAESFVKSGVKEIPAFSFIRSMEGNGKFNPS